MKSQPLAGVFIDESGTHRESPTMSVAGYIFEEEQYERFAESWGEILKEYGLRSFHMVDCAAFRKAFEGWSRKRRDQLLEKLIGRIKLRMRSGLVCSIRPQDLDAIRPSNFTTSPYTFALQWLIGGVGSWADRYGFTGQIAYIFEAGDKHQAEMARAMKLLALKPRFQQQARYAAHHFAAKDHNVFGAGLQAADILAWEWNRDLLNQRAERPRPRRKSLASLLEKSHSHVHLHKPGLETIFEHAPEILRALEDDALD